MKSSQISGTSNSIISSVSFVFHGKSHFSETQRSAKVYPQENLRRVHLAALSIRIELTNKAYNKSGVEISLEVKMVGMRGSSEIST